MEVTICVPIGADITHLQAEYPDIWEDEGWENHQRYFVGMDEDRSDPEELAEAEAFLTYDDAVELCGFVDGLIDGASCLIEGNGGWAQGMISRRDFSGLVMSAKEKRSRKRTSEIYWKAFRRGEAMKSSLSNV